MKRKILFITGSINQTQQMHQIAEELPDYDCWFSQIFTDSPIELALVKYTPLANNTIFKGQFKARADNYLKQHSLQVDYVAKINRYDLVVYCSDMVIAKKFRQTKTIWVQEGMIDKYGLLSSIVQKLNLPAYFSGDTSLNGSTNKCDIYCAASEGYKNYLITRGAVASKIMVTGIPNYDHNISFLNNDFPYRDYVMVATTDMRETFRRENRPAFIKQAVKIANGRKLLFKLHPNEKYTRAEAEIRKYAPAGTLIYQSGNTNEMIANCSELITQYSTVVYVGIALGKKVHSFFDVDELKKLAPIQNGGTSARNIAHICRNYIEYKGDKKVFLSEFVFRPIITEEREEQCA